MPVQAVPITPESIPTDLFLRRTYEEEGPGAALLLLNQHLDMCEASGAGCIEYILFNGQVSRDEFVKSMMQDLENTPADGHTVGDKSVPKIRKFHFHYIFIVSTTRYSHKSYII